MDLVVAQGRQVSIELTMSLEDGTVIESNVGNEPLTYVHGCNQLFPALENALLGLGVNDVRQFTLSPQESFGAVDSNAFMEIMPDAIPPEARRKGKVIITHDPVGGEVRMRVCEVDADKIVLDFNHPLAGHSVNVKVRVLTIDLTPHRG